jgi:putative (di)nucleoside polyphosphate hydrolase
LHAANRELKEETGVESVKFIKEIDNWLTYELPKNLLGKIWKGKYRGQKQKWFIMRFVGDEEEINIKTKNAEFKEWKWIDANQLLNVVVRFKYDVYKSIVKELNILLN